MRLLIAGLFACALIAACGGDDDTEEVGLEERRQTAIAAVQTLIGDDPRFFPPIIGDEYNCTINFPPGVTELIPVQARCRFDTEQQGDDWLVIFREVWACEDFAAEHEDYPPCDATFGFHEWKYLVQLDQNQAQLLDETGQFPPDYVVP